MAKRRRVWAALRIAQLALLAVVLLAVLGLGLVLWLTVNATQGLPLASIVREEAAVQEEGALGDALTFLWRATFGDRGWGWELDLIAPRYVYAATAPAGHAPSVLASVEPCGPSVCIRLQRLGGLPIAWDPLSWAVNLGLRRAFDREQVSIERLELTDFELIVKVGQRSP